MFTQSARLATPKSICSLAATVALTVMSAHACAQSSVQLYGIVDAWAG